MNQLTVDVNDQIAVFLVELLEHFLTADYADNTDVSELILILFFISEIRVIRGSMQSVLVELFENFAAARVYLMQALRHFGFSLAIRCERRRAFHFGIPIPCPTSIRLAQAGRP